MARDGDGWLVCPECGQSPPAPLAGGQGRTPEHVRGTASILGWLLLAALLFLLVVLADWIGLGLAALADWITS